MTLIEITTAILAYAFATSLILIIGSNWASSRKRKVSQEPQETPVSQKKDELKRTHPDPEIFRVDVKMEEENVHAPIDSWMEARLSHPLFNTSFLYSLIPVFENLDFVSNAYVATNGLVRLNIKGRKANMFEDIALHPNDEGSISLIRSDFEDFTKIEDEVLEVIVRHTESIVSSIEGKSWPEMHV